MTSDNSKVIAEAMQSKSELFVQKAVMKHGNLYDYSNVSLKSNHDNVKIICKKHGEFTQRATNHLQGRGCRKCSAEKVSQANRTTFDEFVAKAKLVHGDFYLYPKQDIKRLDDKLKIECPTHGEFLQIGLSHLQGKRCIRCAKIAKLDTKQFVERANNIHGGAYGYDLVEYRNSHSSVKIRCPIHGVFEQAANHHLEGHGCKQCSLQNTHRRSIYEQVCKGKSSLYVIKCSDTSEVFYKIGITKQKIKRRFSANNLPYSLEVVSLIEEDAGIAWDLEKKLHSMCREYKYSPRKRFSGSKHECFKRVPNEVYKLIKHLQSSPQTQLVI